MPALVAGIHAFVRLQVKAADISHRYSPRRHGDTEDHGVVGGRCAPVLLLRVPPCLRGELNDAPLPAALPRRRRGTVAAPNNKSRHARTCSGHPRLCPPASEGGRHLAPLFTTEDTEITEKHGNS